MADGKITIDVDVNGKSVKVATKDIERLEQSAGQGAKGVGEVEKSLKGIDGKPLDNAKGGMKGFSSETEKGKRSVKDFVTALGLVKVAGAVFNVLKDSISGAVERFDTLEKFPKVMQSMGFEAEQSERAMTKMSNSIEGLPTTLNDMVGLTQKFVNITGDLDKSVDIAEALNNAMLASGSSSADAARGIEQYAQMLANGEPDMQSWRSLNETMGYGLKRTAEEMLGAGSSASDLYASLKSGEHTMDEVNEVIIELGGSTGELAELARKNSEGIGTSFANLKNAVVKGLANVMKSLDEVVKASTGKTIAKNLDNMKSVVNRSFDAINSTIKKSTPIVKGVAKVFDIVFKAAKTLSPAIEAVFIAYAGVKIMDKVNASFEKSASAIDMAKKAAAVLETGVDNLTIAKAKELAGLEATNIATKDELANTLASNSAISIKTALLGLLSGQLTIVEFEQMAVAKASGALKAAFDVLAAHPIVATLAILVGTMTAVVKVHKKMNKEFYDSQKAIQDETDGIVENSEAAKDNVRERENSVKTIEDQVDSAKSMVDQLGDLTSTEKANADGKAQIKENVAELNRLYPELNIQYDESTNKINQNAEAIKSQIDAYSAYDRLTAIQENMKKSQTEINDAQAEGIVISNKLEEVQEKKSNWMNQSLLETIELSKTEKALQEQRDANADRQKTLSEEAKILMEQQAEAQEQATQAQKDAIQQMGLQYDFLNDKQQEVVDRMRESYSAMSEASTSFTNDLSYELDMSAQDMINFVEENQRVMSQWGENLDTLTKRGASDGFINQLRDMGPEGAKYAELAVNMSDEEFNKMNSLFEGAPKITEEAWKKAYGMDEIDPAILALVEQGKVSMQEAFASSGIDELLSEQGKNVGKALPEGMEQGINESSEGATSAIKDTSEKVIDGAKGTLGVHSPSTVFAEIGSNLIAGLVQGITSNNGQVAKAINVLKNALVNPLKNIKGQSASAMQGYTASITQALAKSNSSVQNNLNTMKAKFTAFNSSLQSTNKASMSQYTSSITQGFNKAKSVTTSGLNQMQSQHRRFQSQMLSVARNGSNNFASSISNGMNRARSVTTSGSSAMIGSLRQLQSGFYSAGVNASYGLASGIRSGAGSAIAAANSLAAQVTATMKSALKVHSPSRVMRDEVGRFIPQGIAEGIEEDTGKALSAMRRLSDLLTITPERALGVGRMSLAGVGGQIVNNTSSSVKTIENKPLVTMNVIWQGKEDIKRTMETMGWIVNVDKKGALE